jgi:hypothetical protein
MSRFGRLADARILRDFRPARLAFPRRIPGLKGETWGTLRVFSVHWRGGLRPCVIAIWWEELRGKK